MVEAADELGRLVAGIDVEAFIASDAVRSATLWKLAVIGEAAAHVPDHIRSAYPQVAWRRIVGLRNVLVHQYFGIDWEIVWQAAIREVPELRGQVSMILAQEFPESPDSQ